jgi:outer membrane lipoprotein-sorting protein
MKLCIKVFSACLLLHALAWTQNNSSQLENVLKEMDATAERFRSAEASFVWDQFTRVVNETDTQKGKIYFRRHDRDMQMAADITEPDKKSVLYTSGKVQLYQPKIDQITEYNAGKKRADIDSFLVLGFGASGHGLLKSYEVKYAGTENVGGVQSAKLELTPKSQSVLNNISRIILWIDPKLGVSMQQQFFQPTGDYRLAKYFDIQLNQKISDDVFKIKTTGKTKIVSTQGD